MPKEDTQFKSGNQRGPGRPKGSKNKISEDFLQIFHKVWQEHGEAALQQMVKERPADFVKVAASLIPKDFHIQQSVLEQPSLSVALDPDSALAKRLGKADVDNGVPALSES